MKKIIAIAMLVMMTAGTGISHAASAVKVDSDALSSLVKKYEGNEGFEIVSFGNLAMGLVKLVANAAVDEDDRQALDILNGINKFVVVEYFDASASKKESFRKDLSELFRGAEKIIEVKDGGDSVDIYGTLSKDGDRIEDIIIYAPEECSLVCLFGNVRTKDISDVVQMTK